MNGLQLCDTLFYGIFWATSIVIGIDFVWGLVEIWLKHEPPIKGLEYFNDCEDGVCGLTESDRLLMEEQEDVDNTGMDLWGDLGVIRSGGVSNHVDRGQGRNNGTAEVRESAETVGETMEGSGKVEQTIEHDFRAYLEAQGLRELKHLAKEWGIPGYSRMKRKELVEALST